MTKMIKKIAALGAAVTMMASISAMGASAYKGIETNEAFCTAYKTSSRTVYAATSARDSNKTRSVGVNVVVYYMDSAGNLCDTGSGDSNKLGADTYCSAPSGTTFRDATIVHKWNDHVVFSGHIV